MKSKAMPSGVMESEEARYRTFLGSAWPENVPVSTKELASAGFYYIGPGDRVACFACRGCLNGWEDGDVPQQEHKRVFPECLFIIGNSCGNIPMGIRGIHETDSLPSTLPHYATNSNPPHLLVPSKLGMPETGRIIHPLDIVTAKAPTPDVLRTCQHPEFAMEKEWFDSFGRWPARSPVKPLVLARAGFYHTGDDDQVTCFYCGGSLNHWRPDDDPWVEHAKAFRKCEWLMQQQGPYFIQHVTRTM